MTQHSDPQPDGRSRPGAGQAVARPRLPHDSIRISIGTLVSAPKSLTRRLPLGAESASACRRRACKEGDDMPRSKHETSDDRKQRGARRPASTARRTPSSAPVEGARSCVGQCGETLPMTKFPTRRTAEGSYVRCDECRACKAARRKPRSAS